MEHRQNEIARIKTTLAEMTAQAEKLALITVEEGAALRNAEIDLINNTVRNKQSVVESLTVTDNLFRQLLSQLGCNDSAEIDAFLNSENIDPSITQSWRQYIEIMKRCDNLNRQNSALVNIGLRHTRQAIDFLRSCVGEYVEPAVYAPTQRRSSQSGYIIAKA